MEQLNALENYYFNRLKEIFEKNGTSFVRNLTSQYLFNEIEDTYSGKSGIADVMERVVQSIISNNTDWEIFSHPTSSDSSFLTPKAVIHIDCKSTLDTDSDALHHKVDLGKNQTSYASDTPILYRNVPFNSNLPTIYNHTLYGELYALTYFVKIVYNLDDGINSLRNFKLYLCSVPNGLMQPILGLDFVKAGRDLVRPFFPVLTSEEYTNLVNELNPGEESIFSQSYYYDHENEVYKTCDWIHQNGNSLDQDKKELKQRLTQIYKSKNFNVQREKSRVKFLEIPVEEGDEFKWNRYQELTLK
ncbi:hypothetical protein [Bacillus toyonensis]|uniref:hypothetical protein n=1 Tax=Bacillus toyonensis TaxID=155322 RepID=UPI0011A66C86|nr:hypothetical protein [Bacillus toyonensis]UFH98696.1 hypothetical protein HQN46_0004735 [Bacillus toyonensis]